MATDSTPSAATSSDEDFLSGLRINTGADDQTLGIKRVVTTVPLRKPLRDEWFRVHPEHCLDCYAMALKTEGETFIVTREVAEVVADCVAPVRMRLCVNRQGAAFIWPVRLTLEDQRASPWHTSAAETAALASSQWTRMAANLQMGAYETFTAVADFGEPRWPDESWPELLKIALRDRRIDSAEHPVIKRLRGIA